MEWDEIKKEILGEEASRLNTEVGLVKNPEEEESSEEEVDLN